VAGTRITLPPPTRARNRQVEAIRQGHVHTHDLDVHLASESERLAIFRNVHDVWSGGLTLEAHVARRVNSVQHQRAEWYAGSLGQRVVASLGCYPLEFRVHGEVVPGFAIGAVHTVGGFRGQGLAARLLAAVEQAQLRLGRRLAVLFSDIGLGYYERLGYIAGRSHVGTARVDSAATGNGRLRGDPGPAYDELRARCESTHALSIRRTPEYGTHLRDKVAGQRRWLVLDSQDEAIGGFSLSQRDNRAEIEEFFARDADSVDRVVRAIPSAAAMLGAAHVGGWLPNDAVTRRTFEIRPRSKALTMLKPLDGSLRLDAEVLAATDWLNGIDHV
jgi:GNAT superfamily N-acetyltransferase